MSASSQNPQKVQNPLFLELLLALAQTVHHFTNEYSTLGNFPVSLTSRVSARETCVPEPINELNRITIRDLGSFPVVPAGFLGCFKSRSNGFVCAYSERACLRAKWYQRLRIKLFFDAVTKVWTRFVRTRTCALNHH